MDLPTDFTRKLSSIVDDLSEEICQSGYFDDLKELLVSEPLESHFKNNSPAVSNQPEFRIALFDLLVNSMETALVELLEVSSITAVEKNLPGLRRRAFRISIELTVWEFDYRAQVDTLLGDLERRFLLEDKKQDTKFFKNVLSESFVFETKSQIRRALKVQRPIPVRSPEVRYSHGRGVPVVVESIPIRTEDQTKPPSRGR